MIDLYSLQIFCDLVETGSFTHAARRSFISQSAVSQRIRSLEQEFGQSLLERRKGRGVVRPTEIGRTLYSGARHLLSETEALEARIRGDSDSLSGAVRVATVYTLGLHALPSRLKPFLADNPRIAVHLSYSLTEEVYANVLDGSVDVGIVACPYSRPGIRIFSFGEEEMVIIHSPQRTFGKNGMAWLKDLQGQPFVAFSEGIPTRKLIDERLAQAEVAPNIVASFDNIETMKSLVEIGAGFAIVPLESAQREAKEGTLRVVRLAPEEAFNRPTGLILRDGRPPRAAVAAFVDRMCAPPRAHERPVSKARPLAPAETVAV